MEFWCNIMLSCQTEIFNSLHKWLALETEKLKKRNYTQIVTFKVILDYSLVAYVLRVTDPSTIHLTQWNYCQQMEYLLEDFVLPYPRQLSVSRSIYEIYFDGGVCWKCWPSMAAFCCLLVKVWFPWMTWGLMIIVSFFIV